LKKTPVRFIARLVKYIQRLLLLILLMSIALTPTACTSGEDVDIRDNVNPHGAVDGEITILVDDMGIPHIYAANDLDLFWAYGYRIAADRMLQLDMFRRRAHGRLSEVLGAETTIEDQQARIFNWKHWGALDAALMKDQEPDRYALIEAWVAGINRRVAEVRSGEVALPFGFGPEDLDYLPEVWSVDDPFIIQKMAGFGLDQTIQFEVFLTFANTLLPEKLAAIELFKPGRRTTGVPPEDKPQTASITLPAQPGMCRVDALPPRRVGPEQIAQLRTLARMKPLGSNNWAVDGRFTDNGMPMLAGDPHLGYDFSGLLYAVHLNSKAAGGTFDVIGFSFVGAPGIAMGHNDKVIWSPTSAFADVMDMWEVAIADGEASVGGKTVATETRTEVIVLRGDGDKAGVGEEKTVEITDVPGYGVVMPPSLVGSPIPIAQGGKEVLVGWTGFKARPARWFLELDRVQSLDEFDAAALRMPEMTYNFMAADATGITYRVGVEVPDRSPVAEGREPWRTMDGDDPTALWPTTRLPPEKLPHSRAVERGWLATANNDPFGFTDDGVLENDPWYYGAFFAPGWRAAAIEEGVAEMTAAGNVTLEKMQALQLNVHSNLADDLLPVLAESWAAAATDPALADYAGREDLQTLVTLMVDDWDREMTRDSAGALAFHAFAHLVTGSVLKDDMSLLYGIVMDAQPVYILKMAMNALAGEYPNGDKIIQGGRDLVVLHGLAETADWLAQRFGSVDPEGYRYSDMRKTAFYGGYGLGMDLPTVPTDGGESTINVAAATFLESGEIAESWVSHWGPIERMTGGFDDAGTPEAYVNFPMGNIADKASGHFDDQLDGWVNGTYKKLRFTREEIEASDPVVVKLTR